mgnify:FL=1
MAKTNGKKAPSPLKVAIVLPTAGQMCVETAVSLANMVNLTDVETEIIHVKGFLVPEIRSKGVALAWEAKATHILWVDSDMGFPPWALNQLLEAELDIIGVNYPMKTVPPVPTAYVDDEDYTGPLYTETDQEGIQKVRHLGMGVMLTKISVFDRISSEIKDNKPPFFSFEPTPDGLRFMTEDIYFAQRCAEVGIELHVDHGLSQYIIHIGSMSYDNRQALWGRNLKKTMAKSDFNNFGFTEEDIGRLDTVITPTMTPKVTN